MGTQDGVGVVLMTYGSPKTISDIPQYLKNVRGGRDPDKELIIEFERRYNLIGGSPLLRISQAQASLLEARLNEAGQRPFRVVAGMRHAPPLISQAVAEASLNADTIIGIVMSPQYSPIIMDGYLKAIEAGVEALGRNDLALLEAREWHLEPHFIQALREKLVEGLSRFDGTLRNSVHVLMTAHSMPKRVVEREPSYISQLKETASAVAEAARVPDDRWSFCYQSAGHTPEEWLKPDFADMMPILRQKGCRAVLVAPVQFLADHLETLYDIDIAARKQAEDEGLIFARAPALNDAPLFISALAAVVNRTLAEGEMAHTL